MNNNKNKENLERLQLLADQLWEELKNGSKDRVIRKLFTDISCRLVRLNNLQDKNSDDSKPCILDEFLNANNQH
jgi:hypothetical protein